MKGKILSTAVAVFRDERVKGAFCFQQVFVPQWFIDTKAGMRAGTASVVQD